MSNTPNTPNTPTHTPLLCTMIRMLNGIVTQACRDIPAGEVGSVLLSKHTVFKNAAVRKLLETDQLSCFDIIHDMNKLLDNMAHVYSIDMFPKDADADVCEVVLARSHDDLYPPAEEDIRAQQLLWGWLRAIVPAHIVPAVVNMQPGTFCVVTVVGPVSQHTLQPLRCLPTAAAVIEQLSDMGLPNGVHGMYINVYPEEQRITLVLYRQLASNEEGNDAIPQDNQS